MQWQFSGVVAVMLVASGLSACLSAWVAQHGTPPARRPFAVLMAAVAWWSLWDALEAAAVTLAAKAFCSQMSIVGIVAVGPLWIEFALAYGHRQALLSRQTRYLLWVIPAITLVLTATFRSHNLIWTLLEPTRGPQGAAVIYHHGPWAWVSAAYSYALQLFGAAQIAVAVRRSPRIFRTQAAVSLCAVLLPVVATMLYLAGFAPWPGVNLGSVAMTATGLLLAWSVFSLRLTDIGPIARDVVIETMEDGVLAFDAHGRLVDVNPAAARLLGSTATIGRAATEVVAAWPEVCRAVAERRDAAVQIQTNGQTNRWLDARLTGLEAGRGVPDGQLLVVRDITAAKRSEEDRLAVERRLQQAERTESLGVLAGGLAHDFNNLLTSILGHVELARMSLGPASPAENSLSVIGDTGNRLAALTREMLAFSGRGALSSESLDVSDLVESSAKLLGAVARRPVELHTELTRPLPAVFGDPSQLRHLLANLVTNAVEAIGPLAGQITLRTRAVTFDRPRQPDSPDAEPLPAGEYVELAVIDTGCGIDEAIRPRLFEPFSTTRFIGRGLGLAAVLGIVRGHHGGIGIDSRPDVGTTVAVWLPASGNRTPLAPAESRP